jgi:Ser/Thr protein kinase RdoA (MazF antagonist)
MEEVSGQPARTLFTPALWLPGRARAAVRACRRSGVWLRHFHTATQVSARSLDVDAKLANVPQALAGLEQYGFSRRLCAAVAAALSAAGKTLRERLLESAAVHGDFTVNNVLLDRDRVVVLDVGGRHRNAIYHDLASFLNSIRLVSLSQPVPGAVTRACERAFLEGYFGGARPDAIPMWFLRVFRLMFVTLEILGRRGHRLATRLWVRAFVTRLLRSLLNEEPIR